MENMSLGARGSYSRGILGQSSSQREGAHSATIEALKADLKAQSVNLLKKTEELQMALFKLETLERRCTELENATRPNVLMNKLKQQERTIASLERNLVEARRKRARPAVAGVVPAPARCADESLGKRYLSVAQAYNYSTNVTPAMLMDALYRRKFVTQCTKFTPPSFIGTFTMCLHRICTENRAWYDRYYPDCEDTEAVCWKMFELNTHEMMLSYMYYDTIRDTLLSKSNVTTVQMDLVTHSLGTGGKGFVSATEAAHPAWAQHRQQALETYEKTKRQQLMWEPSPSSARADQTTMADPAGDVSGPRYMGYQIGELLPEFASAPAKEKQPKNPSSSFINPLDKIDPLVSSLLSQMT